MNVVAMDGAFGGFDVWVARGTAAGVHRRTDGPSALEHGLASIGEALREADLDPASIDLLAVGTGPGGFTGLRIAISYAKALALGWRRPLAGVNSFDAMSWGIAPPPALAAISAKAGTSSIRLNVGGAVTRFSGPTHVVCDKIATLWTGGDLRAVGLPEDVRSGLGERGIVVRTLEILHHPSIAIAQIAARQERLPDAHAIRADYGEAPPAKIPQPR
ncbi:MAG: hypothetical protein NVS9B12_12930 [Vulcanimicrobiaceae bacterium]